jgi:hypothetical protein
MSRRTRRRRSLDEMNKFFLPILILAALSLSAAERPNVLLILSDDHSMPHVGVYGSANCTQFSITPNLDTFAKQGIRFTRAYTAAPQCAPSRAAIFAGRSPVGLGAATSRRRKHGCANNSTARWCAKAIICRCRRTCIS